LSASLQAAVMLLTALGMSPPPEGLQCRVPLVNVGPGCPIAVLRCVEAVAWDGAQQRCADGLVPALAEAQGFLYHSF